LGDYARITDMTWRDVIQLHGTASDYGLIPDVTVHNQTGIGIFLRGTFPELIGLVQGVSALSLNSNNFSFVSSTQTK